MRPRINPNRINVQQVVEHLEHKRKLYSEAISNLMQEEKLSYKEAKDLLNKRLKEKVIFKF